MTTLFLWTGVGLYEKGLDYQRFICSFLMVNLKLPVLLKNSLHLRCGEDAMAKVYRKTSTFDALSRAVSNLAFLCRPF